MRFKNLLSVFLLAGCFALSAAAQIPTVELPPVSGDAHSFIVANDLGRNGYYE